VGTDNYYNTMYLDPKIWKGGFRPANPKLDPVFSDRSGTRYSLYEYSFDIWYVTSYNGP